MQFQKREKLSRSYQPQPLPTRPVPFPLPTSTTKEVNAWLKHWQQEHLITKHIPDCIIIWDGHWIYEKSGEQLLAELKQVLLHHDLCTKMIVERILREKEVSGFFGGAGREFG